MSWLPILSRPIWDAERKLLLDPGPGHEPLSVIHLAGPGKRDLRKLRVIQGGEIETAVDYSSMRKSVAATPTDEPREERSLAVG